jgi:hypothetical protein
MTSFITLESDMIASPHNGNYFLAQNEIRIKKASHFDVVFPYLFSPAAKFEKMKDEAAQNTTTAEAP